MTEQEMVQGVLSADRAAFHELYQTYKPGLLHTCWCFLGNDAEVEQVAEATVALGIQKMPEFKFQCPLGAWLDHLAVQLCRKLLEKNKKDLLRSVDFFIEPLGQNSKPAYPEETLKLLREEVEQLKGNDKELLSLREFKGWPYEAVANKMKIPVGSALYALFRIRKEMMENVRSKMTATTVKEP